MREESVQYLIEESSAEQIIEERQKLLEEIQFLQEEILRLKSSIRLLQCGYTRRVENLPIVPLNGEINVQDVQTDLIADLYTFAGFSCLKLENSYTFQFSVRNGAVKEEFGVQILNHFGEVKLGKWVLPMSIDIEQILREHPIEKFSNLKRFLRCCKHHLDCYAARKEQFRELKSFTTDMVNCRPDTNFGYTRITVELCGIKETDTGTIHDTILYLFYKSNEARPFKYTMDSIDHGILSDMPGKKFKKYFKPFSKYDLKTAFEMAVGSQTIFLWEKKDRTDDIINDVPNMDTSTDNWECEKSLTVARNDLSDLDDRPTNAPENSFRDEDDEVEENAQAMVKTKSSKRKKSMANSSRKRKKV